MEKNTLNKKKLFYFERIDPMFGRGKRDWSVDVLRCLSCFLVCAIHSTDQTVNYGIKDIGENVWIHHEIYRMAFSSPTVLFVMVSGIFFLSPERNVTIGKVWRKNIIKMTFAYVFWSLIYAFYRIHLMDPQPKLSKVFLAEQWLIEPGHLWYIPMIIGLYMICPILRPITASYDTRLFAYIVAIFMGGMALWTLYNWPVLENSDEYIKPIIDKTPMVLICQYPLWMIFGWLAYTYRPSKPLRYAIYSVGIIAMILGMFANVHNWSISGVLEQTAVTQKFGILQFFKNVALFYFVVTVFRNHEFSNISKLFLRKWSDCTLIIYLIHMLFIFYMYDHEFLYSTGISPWAGVWIYAIIAYFGGGIVAVLFHVVWDPIKKTISNRDNHKKPKRRRSEIIYEKIEKEKKKV